MNRRFGHLTRMPVDILVSCTMHFNTKGAGFLDITQDVRDFAASCGAAEGQITLFVRHTSASLTIQENADPDVLADLTTALMRLAPDHAGWLHVTEGPDDMPAHIKSMLTATTMSVPVIGGALMLGRGQGIYLIEHRARPHRREVVAQFLGAAASAS